MTPSLTTSFDPEIAKSITEYAKKRVRDMAAELASVQPMPNITGLFSGPSRSEEELTADGFVPACPVSRLLWIKK